ncbi:MAG: FIST N-terminal domain-containing protein [Candidatus Omnitrophica bacterium]|nr:FIST N-terminal domain-containing protein [Candidatus Omnitrophota bacterium]MDD5501195.1 FIST N-terminal domain-containing protein [Candidatus Omnitrophota bacterium]
MNISLGFSDNKDHIQATNEAIGQAIIGLGKKRRDLAIIFTTIEFAHPLVLKITNNLLGEIPILGCSSLGIMTNKGIHKHGFAVLLISLGEQVFLNFAAVKDVNKMTPVAAGRDLGKKLLYGCKDVRRNLSLIFSDGLITDGTSLINGLQENLGKSFPLIGVSASDNFAFTKTFQYFNKEALSDSCCGLLFGGKMHFGFGIKHGWKPLGKIHHVTKSEGNIIKEIDGEPAIKLYENYFAKDALELAKELRRISIFYPIGVYLEGEKEYLLRNIISIKDDGSLVTQGDILQDSPIRLMIGTKDSCLSAAAASCEEAKKDLGAQAKFIMVFDSAARFTLLGRQYTKELDIIKAAFGEDVPLIGIYSYGEQAPLKSISYLGRAYFHNQSMNILAFGGQ